jgi:hypothetical protein
MLALEGLGPRRAYPGQHPAVEARERGIVGIRSEEDRGRRDRRIVVSSSTERPPGVFSCGRVSTISPMSASAATRARRTSRDAGPMEVPAA